MKTALVPELVSATATSLTENALAAVTTHDLPTLAGLWTGRDLVRQREAGMRANEEGEAQLRARVRSLADVDDDALAVDERPNLPGTTEAGNWSRALPLALDQIEQDERVRGVARALRR